MYYHVSFDLIDKATQEPLKRGGALGLSKTGAIGLPKGPYSRIEDHFEEGKGAFLSRIPYTELPASTLFLQYKGDDIAHIPFEKIIARIAEEILKASGRRKTHGLKMFVSLVSWPFQEDFTYSLQD